MKPKLIIFLLWNAAVFLIYGTDKLFALKNKRRISEKTLIFLAFFFGGLGAASGMCFFHHKTRKLKFKILIPLAIAVNFIFIGGLLYEFGNLPAF